MGGGDPLWWRPGCVWRCEPPLGSRRPPRRWLSMPHPPHGWRLYCLTQRGGGGKGRRAGAACAVCSPSGRRHANRLANRADEPQRHRKTKKKPREGQPRKVAARARRTVSVPICRDLAGCVVGDLMSTILDEILGLCVLHEMHDIFTTL
ncbi:hypothetical protein I4F81_005646 [Pyropia yezoensis]|uniref:Uncharacterized protein n=1 Tax=Pyropia yezoensis TaxID=2788 RepID=A0ACC3BZP7_PYRYE|nr:hypothetical protein I4F81_005646 [Neopyropia yezoensis]